MATELLQPAFTIPDTVHTRARPIRLLICDVDGVLTDGTLSYDDNGVESKRFHIRDGHGIKMLQQSGIGVAIISGRQSRAVERRAHELGIEHVYQGRGDKIPAYEELLTRLSLRSEQIAYIGDDVVDLPVMLRVGFALTVDDAHPLVKQHAHFITPSVGGRGGVRDACELLLYARGDYTERMQQYLLGG